MMKERRKDSYHQRYMVSRTKNQEPREQGEVTEIHKQINYQFVQPKQYVKRICDA